MQFLRLAMRLSVALVLVSFIHGGALAGEHVVTFDGLVERAIVPSGQKLADESIVGGEISGRLVLSDEGTERLETFGAGKGKTYFVGANKEISISGALSTSFIGGNTAAQSDQLILNAQREYCKGCSASGSDVMTSKAADGTSVTYVPTNYTIIQQSSYTSKDAVFDDTIDTLVSASQEAAPKALIMFSEEGTQNDALKFVLSIKSVQRE